MEKRATDYVKTGMTVKLRSDLKVDETYGSDCFVSDMKDFAGQKVCVSYVPGVPLSSKCVDRFRIVGSNYNFTVDMIENPRPLSESSSESNESELENKPKGGIRFKVGDTVKLRSDLKEGKRYGDLTYMDDMGEPGSEFVVSTISSNGTVKLKDSPYFYSPEMFEPKKDQTKITKPDQKDSKAVKDMKEIKLQVGDVVKIRTDIADCQAYDGICYTKDMIAGGRTAKVTKVTKVVNAFGGKTILYTLDKDKNGNYYTLDMFDLDYILTRNPRFSTLKEETVTPTIHVGDIVRLRSDLRDGETYGLYMLTKTMSKNTGKPVQVKNLYTDGSFDIEGDSIAFHYTPEMVASVEAKLSTKTESRIESTIQDMLSEANLELEDLIRLKVVCRKQMSIEEYSYDELKSCIEDYLNVQDRIEVWKSKVNKLNQFLKDLQVRG